MLYKSLLFKCYPSSLPLTLYMYWSIFVCTESSVLMGEKEGIAALDHELTDNCCRVQLYASACKTRIRLHIEVLLLGGDNLRRGEEVVE